MRASTVVWVLPAMAMMVGRPASAVDKIPASTEIDRLLKSELFDGADDLKLAPRADDETFLRRVYLDVVGEAPTPAEITAFVFDPSTDKRAQVVDRLLADPRYGTNWARYWRDVIVYRSSAAEQQVSTLVAQPLHEFLGGSLNRNDGWDKIARAFVQAEGLVSEHGETALAMVHMAQTANVAAETSRIFLGIQIQCAECHDHPFDKWKRPQFHEFAAFFPRIGLQRDRNTANGMPSLRLAAADNGPISKPPMGQQGGREHFMPDPKRPGEQGTMMQPVFFATGQKLETGATDAERRGNLAAWMTAKDNPWFAKAFVNRIWAELVGEGFCEPIDDLGPERPCAAPKTWESLSHDFADHGYDVKRLFRDILLSDAYQRECRPKRLPEETPFAANVRQPLRADQLIDVLSGAVGFSITGAGRDGSANGPRGALITMFGYDPSIRRDEVSNTVPQALTLMNSGLVNRPLDGANTWFGQMLSRTSNDDVVVTELYLRALAREPNEKELAVCRAHVQSVGNRGWALEDVFWSLLNSEEIRYRN